MTESELSQLNASFENKSPQEIILYALEIAARPVLTTNFGPYSASLVHAVSSQKDNIPVIWGDSGYNMTATYRFARKLTKLLNLNLKIYSPKYTRAYIDELLGDFMADETGHKRFTELVKLEPISRAFKEYKPDVWFTNVRQGQTKFREGLNVFSLSKSGILKVSPFYAYTDIEIETYLSKHGLPNELAYFDPTKIFFNRECGLHLSNL